MLNARSLLLAAALMFPFAGVGAFAEEPSAKEAYVISFGDVTAKVGETAVMKVTARARDGYRILKAYNNRIISLSSIDDGVAFDRKAVPASVEDGTLVFDVGLKPTKPGRHLINAVVRVGYVHGEGEMSMVSAPLIANVTGAE